MTENEKIQIRIEKFNTVVVEEKEKSFCHKCKKDVEIYEDSFCNNCLTEII